MIPLQVVPVGGLPRRPGRAVTTSEPPGRVTGICVDRDQTCDGASGAAVVE